MKPRYLISLILATSIVVAEEPRQETPPAANDAAVKDATSPPAAVLPPGAPIAWLGIDIAKPDSTLTAHLPALPPGIGFVINRVTAGGPGETAGLRATDLLWKLDDQLLVNEAQLGALLRLRQPGEEVVLAVFRGGAPLEIALRLGHAPPADSGNAARAAEDAVFLSEQGPIRMVNFAQKEARYANSEGNATIRKVEDGYWLTIHDTDGDLLFDGRFDRCVATKSEGDDAEIPAAWRRRAHALRRGLDHALEGRMTPQRQPRPRVVAPDSGAGS
jgi:hypothetical protein